MAGSAVRTATVNLVVDPTGVGNGTNKAAAEVDGLSGHFSKFASVAGLGLTKLSGALGGEVGEFAARLGEGFDSLDEHAGKLSKGMTIAGSTVGGLGAALTLAGSSDQAASQQLAQAIQNTGRSVDDYKDSIEGAVKTNERYGDTAVQTQHALQILTEATGDPAVALRDLSVATNLAADRNLSLSDAATAVGKTYDGSTKTLKLFGITTAAVKVTQEQLDTAQQHATNTGVEVTDATDKYREALDHYRAIAKPSAEDTDRLRIAHDNLKKAQQDNSAAQKKLSQETADFKDKAKAGTDAVDELGQHLRGQGDAAADTFRGHLEAVRAEITDHVMVLGQKYGPAITAVGTGLGIAGQAVQLFQGRQAAAALAAQSAAAQQMAANTEVAVSAASTAAAVEGADVGEGVASAASALAIDAADTAETLGDAAVATAATAADVAEGIALAPILALAAPIVAALALVGVAAYELEQHWSTVWAGVRDAAEAVWHALEAAFDGIVGAAKAVVHGVEDAFGAVESFFQGLPGRVEGYFADAEHWLQQAGGDVMHGLEHGVETGAQDVWSFLTSVPGKVEGLLGDAGSWLVSKGLDALKGMARGAVTGLADVATFEQGVAGKVIGWIGDAGSWLLNAGAQVIQGLIQGIESMSGKLAGTVGHIAKDVVEAPFTHALSIFSPSRVFHDHGVNLMLGLAQGLDASAHLAGEATSRAAKTVDGAWQPGELAVAGDGGAGSMVLPGAGVGADGIAQLSALSSRISSASTPPPEAGAATVAAPDGLGALVAGMQSSVPVLAGTVSQIQGLLGAIGAPGTPASGDAIAQRVSAAITASVQQQVTAAMQQLSDALRTV